MKYASIRVVLFAAIMLQILSSSAFAKIILPGTINTDLKVDQVSAQYGSTITLTAKLTVQSSGAAIANVPIAFTFNNSSAGSALTDANGVATISGISFTNGVGTHNNVIKADFNGNDTYKKTSGSNNLIVSPAPTTLLVRDELAPYGSTINFMATLTSNVTGLGVAGKYVKFLIDGVLKDSALTNSSGEAKVSIYNPGSVGTHTILGKFTPPAGDNYSSSNGTGTLTITERPTVLQVANVTGTYGGIVTLQATLTSLGSPLNGKEINFTVNGTSAGSAITGSDGVATKSFSLTGLGASSYQINANFSASDGYESKSATGTLTVNPAPTSITVTDAAGTYGGKVDLSATLTSNGTAVAGQEIYFELSGVSAGYATTDVNGAASVKGISITDNAGSYPNAVKAYFTATSNYQASEKYGNLTVSQAPTTIEVSEASGPYGGRTSPAARLTVTSSGNPIIGVRLYFKINGVDKGNDLTDADGKVTLINVALPLINAGTYNDYIEVSFTPSGGNYAASTGKGPLEITPAQTTTSITDVEALFGSKITLSAVLTSNVTGAAVVGKTVDFLIDGVSKGSAPTNSSGVAALENMDPDVAAGEHTILAGFTAPAGDNYSSSSGTAKLTLTQRPTELSVTPVTGSYGGTVTLKATLTTSGAALPGKTISFTVNGTSAGSATTGSDGVATKSFSLTGLDAASYEIKADFAASDGYKDASAKGTLTVEAASTSLIVDDAEGIYGGTADFSATLTSDGSPLVNKTLSFKLGDVSLGGTKTDLNGKATVSGVSLSGYDARLHTGVIKAEFTSDGNYESASASGSLNVKRAPTTLAADNVMGAYGAKVTLTATLTTSGSKLNNETISFKLNGSPVGAASTNSDGVATLNDVSLGDIPVGKHDGYIEAIFSPEGGNYEASTGKSQLEVTPAATTLALEKVEAPFGSNATLKATLSSGTTLLSGRTISFTLGGTLKGTAATGLDGAAALNVSLEGIGVGTYTNYIGASFTPSADNYSGSTASADLKVTELPTDLSVTNVTGTFGGSVTLEATLTSSGSPLGGKTINFTVNGNPAGPATTGLNGTASLTFSLAGFNAGTYTGKIKADFTAADGYAAASATGDLTVEQAPTSLAVSEVTGTFGGSVELKAILTSNGAPLENRTISFKLNGKDAGKAKTDANGLAVLPNVSLNGIDAGSHKDIITADFSGEENYKSSTGLGNLIVNQAPVTIVVSKATGPYNGKASLKATLTLTSTGSPLIGLTLSFKLNGSLVGTALTVDDGSATLPEVSIAGLEVGTYNDYIEASFSPLAGNYAAGTGKGTLEVVQAPTSLAVTKVTAVYGSKVTLTATLTSLELPLSGKTVEFKLNNVSVGTAATDVNGLASLPNVDLAGIGVGPHTAYIAAGFADETRYKGSSNTADLEITKASTTISVLPEEVQYSDQVTLTAVVTSAAAQGSLNTAGGSVEFKYKLGDGAESTLGTVSSSTIVNGSLNFTYTFSCMFTPGTYKILARFTPADKDNFDGSSNLSPFGPLTVSKEDANAEYTGLTYFSTASPTSYNVTLTYSATITDLPDDYRGNISKARVDFIETPSDGIFKNGIEGGTNLPVYFVNPADTTIGTSLTQPFSRTLSQSTFNNLGATYNVNVKVSGNYSKLSDPALITIGIPGNDNISGGGFIIAASSAGKYRSKAGTKTNFGFTMKYNKSGKNNQGQANIIIRGENDKLYQIKSNAINSMSVYTVKDSPGKYASFSTKANLTDITDPYNPVSLGGSLSLTVEMYDGSENNADDAIAITLQDPGSGLLYSNSWNGKKTALQILGGGNIKVLSSSGLAKGMADMEIIPTEYALYQNFPNPFNPSTNIQFDLPEDSRVKIVIYNILGREVATIINDDLPAGKHQAVWNSQDGGGSFASGMYILRITAKSYTSQRNLVATKKMMLVK